MPAGAAERAGATPPPRPGGRAQEIGAAVLHYDRDYDTLSGIMESESAWLARPGSLPDSPAAPAVSGATPAASAMAYCGSVSVFWKPLRTWEPANDEATNQVV